MHQTLALLLALLLALPLDPRLARPTFPLPPGMYMLAISA